MTFFGDFVSHDWDNFFSLVYSIFFLVKIRKLRTNLPHSYFIRWVFYRDFFRVIAIPLIATRFR